MKFKFEVITDNHYLHSVYLEKKNGNNFLIAKIDDNAKKVELIREVSTVKGYWSALAAGLKQIGYEIDTEVFDIKQEVLYRLFRNGFDKGTHNSLNFILTISGGKVYMSLLG